ncbi:MAG: glycosyltransferase family 2 protein [Thermodesulfobacteriota bacterium]|nr:glycosyltransferase family 2 protein [Thermodesulfobacteriota bacterium]
MKTVIIIPALNEEEALPLVLKEIPEHLIQEVVVVDNGSLDNTQEVARSMGATVLYEPTKGYGSACLKGMEYLRQKPVDVVVFMDGDGSNKPEEIESLIEPIKNEGYEFAVGSRNSGKKEKGALFMHQLFGNYLVTFFINRLFGTNYTDLGPFRAIRFESLLELDMEDKNFGWTVEMQIKAAKKGLKITEIPVSSRKRLAGRSKVSGNLLISLLVGIKMMWVIFKYAINGKYRRSKYK